MSHQLSIEGGWELAAENGMNMWISFIYVQAASEFIF